MAHRSRSKTADSAESKKTKGQPRRLTEKIAIMRRKEHEQSEAFEQAMKSIFEMQRARIHGGGGSMPSLQNIDSTPPPPTIDMQMVYKDFNEMTSRGTASYSPHKERPRSGGPAGRRGVMGRAASSETDPYPMMGIGSTDHGPYWNAGPDWIDGDLSRHKSDSDLQQSLLLQGQQGPGVSPHHSPLLLGSPQQQPKNHKLSPPGDLSLYKPRTRPNSMTAHALLSPDQYVTSPDAPQGSPTLGMSGGGTASSLPDLTNIDFSSGLDVPLESDDDSQLSPQQVNSTHQPPAPGPLGGSQYHSPTSMGKGPGPSKLIYTSYQAPPSPVAQRRIMFQSPFPINHSQQQFSPSSSAGILQQHIPNPGMGMRHPSPFGGSSGGGGLYPQTNTLGGIQKSPTMPDFRTLNNYSQHASAPISQFKPILPSLSTDPNQHQQQQLPSYRPLVNSLPPFISSPQQQGNNLNSPLGLNNGGMDIPPPMTIIIQPPPASSGVNMMPNGTPTSASSQMNDHHHPMMSSNSPLTTGTSPHHQPLQQQQQNNSFHHHSMAQQSQQHQQHQQHGGPQTPTQAAQMSPQAAAQMSPQATAQMSPQQAATHDHAVASPSSVHQQHPPQTPPVNNLLPTLSFSQHKMPFTASLPNTPTITVGPGLPVLPSYIEAKQQQALQQKLAAISVGRDEPLFRSHSEENLQKVQKEPSGMIQHNPFMGTLANANSVPCVYVESANTDNANEMNDRSESPTTVDSPSTSASYASSPPSVRPFWMDLPPNMHDFVFHEWPPLGTPGSAGGGAGMGGASGASGSGQGKPSSPPAHHRSLTDLNTIPEVGELSSPNRSKNLLHQLSLPSVAMTDLTVDETYYGKNPQSPSDFFLPPDADFDMEDAVMNSLLSNEVPDLDSFDVNVLTSEANMLASEVLMSSSPDSFLHGKTSFN